MLRQYTYTLLPAASQYFRRCSLVTTEYRHVAFPPAATFVTSILMPPRAAFRQAPAPRPNIGY